MDFTLSTWQQSASDKLRGIGNWLERRKEQEAPYLLYGALCGLSLWPLVEAAQSGQLLPAMIALGSVAGGIGGNLIAEQIQSWKDRADEVDASEIADWVVDNATTNTELRGALDAILEKLDAIPQAQAAIGDADQLLFTNTLRSELAQLGNLPHFEVILLGSGAVAKQGGVAAGARGTAIKVDNTSIAYILNQVLSPEGRKSDPVRLHQQVESYLTWLQARCSKIELRGIKREGQQVVQLDLNEVYVPLEAHSFHDSRSIGLNEVLGLGRRILITGGPGSGKTTALLNIAWTMATAIATDNLPLAHEKLGFKDDLLDELKAVLENACQVTRQKRWFGRHELIQPLGFERVQELVAQLVQIGKGDPLPEKVKEAQECIESLTPAAREVSEIEQELNNALQSVQTATEDLESAREEVTKIEIDGGKTDVLMRMRQRIAELTDRAISAEAKVVKYRGDLKEAERKVSENAEEADRAEHSITQARNLALEMKHSLPLPIFIPLSAYAAHLRLLSAATDPQDTTLATFISRYLIEKQSSFDLSDDFFRQVLRDGRAVILLLDGLDEVPYEAERVRIREAIEELVMGRDTIWVVATCRTAAHQGRTALGRGFREIRVKPLEDRQITDLVRRAYMAIYPHDPTASRDKANELLQGIRNLEEERRRRLGEQAEPLVTSPLLVRMLLMVHFSQRRLPEHRAELYMRATDVMLLPEYAPDEAVADQIGRLVGGSREIHRELAQHLAFAMHSRGETQGREIREDELRQVLTSEPSFAHLVDEFIALTRLRGTLLEERTRTYRFIHLSFQEYLTARYLAEVERDVDRIATFFEEGAILNPWWREPALLTAGYLSLTSPQIARLFLRRLGGIDDSAAQRTLPPDVQLAAVELATMACLEWLGRDVELRRTLFERLVAFLRDPDSFKPPVRTAAGDVLARLGDPRFRASAWYLSDGPLLGFVEIPAGAFLMGSDKEHAPGPYKDELPQHTVKLPTYYSACYPVTVAQFRTFVRESGYRAQGSWEQDSSLDNHPVVAVTWYDALAYCHWLTDQLRAWEGTPEPLARLLREESWQVRLPTEAEWEKAARGTDGRIYPWGNEADVERANYGETGIGTTSAVGCFAGGGTPYGVLDMSGNVLEWCHSLYKPYPYDPMDGRENPGAEGPRVLRGGSFVDNARLVRCAFRLGDDPGSRHWDLGFRMCVAPGF